MHGLSKYDCIVLGAGIAGAAAARALAREGRRVLVLERERPGSEASGAAAGMLAPQVEASHEDTGLALALAARDRYPALIAELAAAGLPVEFNRAGITLVAFDPARAAELRATVEAQRAMGLDAEWLDAAALKRRQPGIGPEAVGALLAPHDGSVDNVTLMDALVTDATRHGAQLVHSAATEVVIRHGRVAGVRTAAGLEEAPAVVLAAGPWSALVPGLPRRLPIEPVRGQMAAARWPAAVPRMVLFGRGAYVVPRHDEAVLGSTMEKTGFEKSTTPEGLDHIRRETTRLLPALGETAFTRAWAGLRPMTPDHRPIIGRDPDVEGLFYDTGHGRNGILLGPLCGDVVRDLVVRGETTWELQPYRVDRF